MTAKTAGQTMVRGRQDDLDDEDLEERRRRDSKTPKVLDPKVYATVMHSMEGQYGVGSHGSGRDWT